MAGATIEQSDRFEQWDNRIHGDPSTRVAAANALVEHTTVVNVDLSEDVRSRTRSACRESRLKEEWGQATGCG
jgi:PIN domain nuclease of toxin-antitoxin system